MDKNSRIIVILLLIIGILVGIILVGSSDKTNGTIAEQVMQIEQTEQVRTLYNNNVKNEFTMENVINTLEIEGIKYEEKRINKLKLDETSGKYSIESKIYLTVVNNLYNTNKYLIELKTTNRKLNYISIIFKDTIENEEKHQIVRDINNGLIGEQYTNELIQKENGVTVQHNLDKHILKLYNEKYSNNEKETEYVYHAEVEYEEVGNIDTQGIKLTDIYKEMVEWMPTLQNEQSEDKIKTKIGVLDDKNIGYKLTSLETDNTIFDAKITLNFKYNINNRDYNIRYTIVGKETQIKLGDEDVKNILNKTGNISIELEEQESYDTAVGYALEILNNIFNNTIKIKYSINEEEREIIEFTMTGDSNMDNIGLNGEIIVGKSTADRYTLLIKMNITDETNYIQ